MDAPAMLTRKHVPEDVGLRDIAEDEGSQQQLHRDEKQHKPVLKKVKEKVKKIKNTLAGHGHGHGDEHGHDERLGDGGGSTSSEEGEEDMLEREAAMEKGGYLDDVEDKPVAMESDPEVHGAPMYESAKAQAVQDLVAKYDPARAPAAQEVRRDDAPRVRFGDLGGPALQDPAAQGVPRDNATGMRLGNLGGPVVEDPAAPRSATPAAREGQDIGTTPVVREFESMTLSDDPAHVGAGKQGARAEEWKDVAADTLGTASGGGSYTDKLKNAATVPTEYGKKLASTVYEKVAGVGAAVGVGKRGDDERAEAMPVSDDGGEEWSDAPAAAAATDATDSASGPGYTDKIKSAAAGTTEYGKQLSSTVYEKVAAAGTAVVPSIRPQVGAGKPDVGRDAAMPVSDAGAEERKSAASMAATDNVSGVGYTDKIKSAAAGTTEYGKQLANTVYEKVAGAGTAGAPSLRPHVGAGKPEGGRNAAMPVSEAGAVERNGAATTDATDNASGVGYTDKIKSAAVGTTEYGKQLASAVYEKVAGAGTAGAPSLRPQVGAGKPEDGRNAAMPVSEAGAVERNGAATTDATDSASGVGYTDKIKSAATTVYEKVAGVGTAAVGKVQQATQSAGTATPGVGAQQDTSATATPGAGGQDKGVTVTGYIAEKLRPGDEDRALSEAISGAVQRRKEDVGGTVAQRVPAPTQVITRAREAVASLTGGNRVSEAVAVQPTGGDDAKEGVAVAAVEEPVLHREEIGDRKLNTNTM